MKKLREQFEVTTDCPQLEQWASTCERARTTFVEGLLFLEFSKATDKASLRTAVVKRMKQLAPSSTKERLQEALRNRVDQAMRFKVAV